MHARTYQRLGFFGLLVVCCALWLPGAVQAQTTPPTDADQPVEIEFYVIGFGVDDATTQQLKQIAEVTNGVYFDAQSQQDLEAALSQGVGAGNVAPVGAEVEPNNNFGKATTIRTDSDVQGMIAAAGDVDWYLFEVPNQGELQLSITNVAPELAIDVRLWNANKDPISDWIRPLAKGGDTSGVIDLPTAGRYYLEIAEESGAATSDQPYAVQTVFQATAEIDEPNGAFGSASALALATPLQANILPRGDADWYQLVVDQHGELKVTISNVAAELAIALRVWNANKEPLTDWFRPLAAGAETQGIIDLPAAGSYYLEVVENSGAARAIQPYTIEATFLPAADPNEPNNRAGSATAVALGATQVVNLLPQGDADWFTFAVDWQGQLDVAITRVPPALAVDFRVWNANLDPISDWLRPLANGGDNLNFVDLPAAGRYYVELVEDSGALRAIEPFSVTFTFTRTVDSFEANDSFGQASNLGIDRAVQTNILPRGESDWHYLDVTQQGELQILVGDVAANLAIAVRVWNANKDPISDWLRPLAKGGDTSGAVDLPEPGRYYLEVVEDSGSARAIQPFTLQTQFAAAADQGEPNNTIDTATPVSLDTTMPANILPANDADWCRLVITTTGELHVLISNVAPTLELAMRLWNDQPATVSDWVYPLAAGGDTQAVFPIGAPGVYYLEVVDNNQARSIQPYLLRFSMAEIDPATLVFTQIVTDTTTATATSATTTTVTTVITVMTTTVTASGTLTDSQVITSTDVLTGSEVITATSALPAATARFSLPLPTNRGFALFLRPLAALAMPITGVIAAHRRRTRARQAHPSA